MDDEKIEQFCNVTNATKEIAQNHLESTDGNLEQAVQLYFASNLPSTSDTQPKQEPEVRAPIPARHEIIADDSWHAGEPVRFGDPVSSSSVFNQSDSSRGRAINRSGSLRAQSEKGKRLAELFRPPYDIMTKNADLDDAIFIAREKKRWLLIDIQDPTEFQCQVLNRDLWSELIVKDIVKESFVFVQYKRETPEGQQYQRRYNIEKYPHVAIIDARTAERVKVWDQTPTDADFMMEVTGFLEAQTELDAPNNTPKRKKANVTDMSEEEQLNAAIAASLAESSVTPGSLSSAPEDHDQLTSSPHPNGDETVNQSDSTPLDKPASLCSTIKAVKRDEPGPGTPDSTRIQLRMADGKKIIRRFLKTDPVRYLFEFVRAETETNGEDFELVFNRTQLIDLLDKQIQEAGLTNAAINFQFA